MILADKFVQQKDLTMQPSNLTFRSAQFQTSDLIQV
jgi:hypothetical protein